jgi:hypothetical protein
VPGTPSRDDDRPDDDETTVVSEPKRPPLRSKPGAGEVIGNAIVGLDYAVFRATKPSAILVEAARPVRGIAGEGGTLLSIDLPDSAPDLPADVVPERSARDR